MTPYPADDITRLETEVEVLRSKEDNLLCVHGGVWISFGNLAVRWDKVIPMVD